LTLTLLSWLGLSCLLQFGIFALVLFGLATLNLILCIIDGCGVGAIATSAAFIGFYVRTLSPSPSASFISLSFFLSVALRSFLT
jgi:hypothetical protein